MRLSDDDQVRQSKTNPRQRAGVTCDDAPFLGACQVARYRGEECLTGSFSVTLESGALVVGKMWETRNTMYRNKFYRTIEVNGIQFQLRNGAAGMNDELFPALSDGEEFDASVIQMGAKGRFNLSTAGGLCRSGYI